MTITPVAERLAMELSLPVNFLGLFRVGNKTMNGIFCRIIVDPVKLCRVNFGTAEIHNFD